MDSEPREPVKNRRAPAIRRKIIKDLSPPFRRLSLPRPEAPRAKSSKTRGAAFRRLPKIKKLLLGRHENLYLDEDKPLACSSAVLSLTQPAETRHGRIFRQRNARAGIYEAWNANKKTIRRKQSSHYATGRQTRRTQSSLVTLGNSTGTRRGGCRTRLPATHEVATRSSARLECPTNKHLDVSHDPDRVRSLSREQRHLPPRTGVTRRTRRLHCLWRAGHKVEATFRYTSTRLKFIFLGGGSRKAK